MSERISDMSEKMADRMSEDILGDISKRMSE